jgi:hypothetical protein
MFSLIDGIDIDYCSLAGSYQLRSARPVASEQEDAAVGE